MLNRLALAFSLVVATATSPASAAEPSPSSRLEAVIADHWKWWLAENPISATTLGVRDHDRKIGDLSLESRDLAAREAKAFITRLDAIPDAGLPLDAQVNKAILRRMLDEQVEANRFGQRTIVFTSYYSPFQGYAAMGEDLPFDSKEDYLSYLARLESLRGLAPSIISISQKAISGGYAQPCVTLGGFEKTITGAVAGAADDTRFFSPFRRKAPAGIDAAEWKQLQDRARTLINDVIRPQYLQFADFYTKSYKPKCRKQEGASSMPDGKAWYASQIRLHTTTALSADDIHTIGLKEVARITARMEQVSKEAGFSSLAAFKADLRSNPKFYAKTPEELMAAAARMAKQIDGLMPRYFKTLPRLPYGLKMIPAETAETTTTAYYSPGSPPTGLAGNYYVNTSKLNQRPLFELPALTAHEAVPGHHHQIALQQELTLPDFRKYAVGFTSFVEGWGLYSEYLGEEMGLYDTPEKMMGRLSYEMWRACRLVVDTGIHSKGWTKAQAITFMKDNSALAEANIEAEVNRYISWPGQALGYKLGEIRIRELRAKAEKALGAKFNLRLFHDAVLTQGPVPLDVLERQIDAWIATQLAGK